jgi:predicted nucleic acid-binding protein
VNSPLRILLDVNVWVTNLMASTKGRRGTAAQRIVSMVTSGRWGDDEREVQLVISIEMLETLDRVLKRHGATPDSSEAFIEAIKGIMKYGPDELDPYLVFGGHEQFAMADVEDAGVLATAFAARANLLVTDNLKDFWSKDALRVDTRIVKASSGSRQLHALRHQRYDVDVIVAHPLDVLAWLEQRLEFEPDALWNHITSNPANRT